MIVRSIGGPLYFAAMAFFLLGGNAENGKQLNIIRYSGGLGLIAFAVFTDFNGFFLFGLVEIGLAVVTGNSIIICQSQIEVCDELLEGLDN